MKRRLVVSVVLLALLAFAASRAWTFLGWPPPRLVLKYGIPPYCAPTGKTMDVEGIEFVEIGPGCFRMGSDFELAGARTGYRLGRALDEMGLPGGIQPIRWAEMPVHWVEFESGFWIARTEVTNVQLERFKPDHERSESSPGDGHPVVDVSWEDAKAWCEWLSEKSGREVRLPSEAMWEASCRGGSESEYCFGDDKKRLGKYAWYDGNSSWGAHEVGSRQPNAWGLFDLHGNVWEWCEDAYHEDYENAPTDGSAWTQNGVIALNGSPIHVYRGGSWADSDLFFRSAFRQGLAVAGSLGFRPCIYVKYGAR